MRCNLRKIGIVTWYYGGYNYGSSLQAFAMQTIIRELGYETEFIDYVGDKKLLKKIKDKLKKPYLFLFKNKVYHSWVATDMWTIKYLRISKKYDTWHELEKLSLQYDAVVCGSDQIWRHNGDGKIDGFYFLQFAPINKRISYAPSIARNYVDNKIKKKMKKYIGEIKFLSIREEIGAKLLEKETGYVAEVVLDPTLLLSQKTWESFIGKHDLDVENYIFCYLLTYNEKYNEEICAFSKKINLKVISPAILSNDGFNSIPMDCFTFIDYIINSNFLVTDSYHGILFCLKFNKKFAVYKRFADSDNMSQNSRIYSILKKVGLLDRIVDSENGLYKIYNEKIDYARVNNLIEKEQLKSKKYLIDAIDSVTNN